MQKNHTMNSFIKASSLAIIYFPYERQTNKHSGIVAMIITTFFAFTSAPLDAKKDIIFI